MALYMETAFELEEDGKRYISDVAMAPAGWNRD
jgi:hypothetical protein